MNKYVQSAYLIFVWGTMLSLIMSGVWWGASQTNIVNGLTGVSAADVQSMGGWTILKAGQGFIHALITMLSWDYPFLSGDWAILIKMFFLYPVSIGVLIGLYEMFMPVLFGLASAIRNLLP